MRDETLKCGFEQKYVKEISSDKILLTAEELRQVIRAAILDAESPTPSPINLSKTDLMNKFEDYLGERFLKESPCDKDSFERLFLKWANELELDDWLQLSALFFISLNQRTNQ